MYPSQTDARPIRVLMVSTDLQRGGLPLRLVKLAYWLKEAGFEPIVGCLTPPGPLSHELSQQGVTTFSCMASGPLDASCLWRLAHQIRYFNPDVIHASLFHANLAARLVGRWDRARPIITSTVTIEIERPLHRALESLTSGCSDVHVANSQAVAAHLRDELGFDARRVVVIPNGIDIEAIDAVPGVSRAGLGLSDDKPLIVWAGRMDPVKDLSTFVQVIARVRDSIDVQALLLGDGPIRTAIEREIASRDLTNIVRIAGWSHDVAGWLKIANALLFPSLTEGCPNVVLEAMACRCPVVASDIPSCRELIRHGQDGLLCAPRNVEEFSNALLSILTDRPRARAWAASARDRASGEHQMSKVAGRWAALYRSCLRSEG